MKKAKEFRHRLCAVLFALAVGAGVFGLGFFQSAFISHAEAQAKVTSPKSINIRQEASTSSAVVSGAESGKVLTVLGSVQGGDGYTWYKVQVDANTTGYVRSDLVSVTGDVPVEGGEAGGTETSAGVVPLDPVSAIVQGDSARIRDSASSEGQILAEVPESTVLTVTGQATDNDGRIWYQASYIAENAQVDGFIRSDFVVLETGSEGGQEEGETEQPSGTTSETKPYETLLRDGEWMLVDNQVQPPQGYSIDQLFGGWEKNMEMYEESEKQVKNQKIIIIVLVFLLVAAAAGIAFLVFKVRDMMDSAYFNEVENETLRKKNSGGGQRVMHTVGKEKPPAGARPAGGAPGHKNAGGAQGPKPAGAVQGTRPAGASQGQRPAGAVQGARPAGAPQSQRPAGSAAGTRPAGMPQGQRPAGAAQGQRPGAGTTGARPVGAAQSQRAGGNVRPQRAEAPQGARPAGAAQSTRPAQSAQASAQKARTKNFMADDEFEYEYLGNDADKES